MYSFTLLEKIFFLFDQEAQENTRFMLFCLNKNIIHIACVFFWCTYFFWFFFHCLVSRQFTFSVSCIKTIFLSEV